MVREILRLRDQLPEAKADLYVGRWLFLHPHPHTHSVSSFLFLCSQEAGGSISLDTSAPQACSVMHLLPALAPSAVLSIWVMTECSNCKNVKAENHLHICVGFSSNKTPRALHWLWQAWRVTSGLFLYIWAEIPLAVRNECVFFMRRGSNTCLSPVFKFPSISYSRVAIFSFLKLLLLLTHLSCLLRGDFFLKQGSVLGFCLLAPCLAHNRSSINI